MEWPKIIQDAQALAHFAYDAGRYWVREVFMPLSPPGTRCTKCHLVRRLKNKSFQDWEGHFWGFVECGCGLAFRRLGADD